MGRPPQLSGDLVSISVQGKGAAWCDGQFAGDPDILTAAREAVELALPVQIRHDRYEAGDDNALAALAALMSYSTQSRIVACPDWVAEEINSTEEENPAAWDSPDEQDSGEQGRADVPLQV